MAPGKARPATPRVRKPLFASLVLLGVLRPLAVSSQDAPTLAYGQAEDVGMSPAGLARAAALYHDAVEKGELVGAVLLVARRGRVVLHEALGWRDRGERLPMERSTLFRMASNTKPVVATAVAQLVEQGRLAYDAPVGRYIPEWRTGRSGDVTVAHLLTHTSGLRISTLFLRPLLENATLRGEAARFAQVGPEAPVGGEYSYSNPGYNTLGALVEIASGRALHEQLRVAIYEPLGMKDSYNYRAGDPVDGKLGRMGPAYYERGDDGEWMPAGTPGGPTAFPFARGSGGMISTAWDYAIFTQTFLNGGAYDGVRILTRRSVEAMTTPRVEIPEGGSYGYGWRLDRHGFGHGGSDGTNAWIDPDDELVVLAFTQTPRGRPPMERFVELVREAIVRP